MKSALLSLAFGHCSAQRMPFPYMERNFILYFILSKDGADIEAKIEMYYTHDFLLM